MSENDPKSAKTSRNDPPKIPKQPEIGEIWNFLLVFVLQISILNAQI